LYYLCQLCYFSGVPKKFQDGNGEKRPLSGIVRGILLAGGSVSLSLGILGVFLPILPTTPFLIVAGGCYVRSSDRLYRWLMGNRFVGKYLAGIARGKGLTLRAKVTTLSIAWLVLLASMLLARSLVVTAVLVTIGLLKTVLFFTIIRTDRSG
jgi:uncharacterized membrane protein YbaN (DUF454 family)